MPYANALEPAVAWYLPFLSVVRFLRSASAKNEPQKKIKYRCAALSLGCRELLGGDTQIKSCLGIGSTVLLYRQFELRLRGFWVALGQVGAAKPVMRLGKVGLDFDRRLKIARGLIQPIVANVQQRAPVGWLGSLLFALIAAL